MYPAKLSPLLDFSEPKAEVGCLYGYLEEGRQTVVRYPGLMSNIIIYIRFRKSN